MKPVVFLVGSGPGNIDLLTLRAYRAIVSADCLIVDALVSDEIIALGTNAKIISVGKRAFKTRANQAAAYSHTLRENKLSMQQADINTILVEQGLDAQKKDQTVVRLKGGDPLIFARAEEEIDALNQAGISFEIIPGISAVQAAHAQLKRPMTRRGVQRALVIATPQVQSGDTIGVAWARPLVAAGGGAIYMAATAASRIKGTLLALGLAGSTPVTWVADAGRPGTAIFKQHLETLCAPPAHPNAALILLVGTESQTWTSSSILGVSRHLQQPAQSLV